MNDERVKKGRKVWIVSLARKSLRGFNRFYKEEGEMINKCFTGYTSHHNHVFVDFKEQTKCNTIQLLFIICNSLFICHMRKKYVPKE